MKASELRIGNFVYQEQTIDDLEIVEAGLGTLVNALCLKPIPLTEEWLIKFGFEYCDMRKEYRFDNYCCVTLWASGLIDFTIENIEHFEVSVKYVHELQNLYFALTGEELTIKE